MKISKNFQTYQDPSLAVHISTIHDKNTNIPKLKYSLACIANTLSYNNSNRHIDIISLTKQENFKQIIFLLTNHQDQKILELSLSILNILLNQGNDLTLQEEAQIMHSLSYVKINNDAQKTFISDHLVQEILNLTYKLKTRNSLSSFLATLMSQKMSATQAKNFVKQLKKQQLKNIMILDLMKIAMKFKTNVPLMNYILNLVYEKVIFKKDQAQIKKLYQFLPKIVEQNISQKSLSYKCLQIYKLIEKNNSQFDPLISKYLNSLLKYKRQLLLPLKRQIVSKDQEFQKILDFGTEFEIYHILLIDYLVENGYKNGKQTWVNAINSNSNKKNPKLKKICTRLADQENGNQKSKSLVQSYTQQAELVKVLPIQTLTSLQAILQKLISEPTISNCLYVIKNLCFYSHSSQLLLTIHKIALKSKQFHLVEQIQKVVQQGFNQQFVYNEIKNITKVKHKIVLKGQLFFIWLPILMKSQKFIKNMENELAQIMNYDSIQIQQKFYVVQFLLENKLEKPLIKFLLYLNRQLESINSLEQQSKKVGQNLFLQCKYYLRKWLPKIKNNKEIIDFYFHKILFHLERTAQLLFSKVVQFKSEAITTLLFELQKWDFFGQSWRQPYRWILIALEQIYEQNPIFTLDCLQIFEMCVQNIKQNDIPAFAKQRFMKSVKKNWSKFESQHLFAIQRILQILWQDHQYPLIQTLQPIKPIYELIQEQKKFNKKNEYFFQIYHPTSNYLINIEMSHFLGVISQQEFIKHILQLYDKKHTDVKRFTQKNVISLINMIIWIYEYSQEDMDKGFSQIILAFLGYKSQDANLISSYNILKKCIQILAGVSHSINLLKLPIKYMLQTYIGQPSVMKNINQIIQTIIESKASFIQQLNLQKIIESVMINLITCQNTQLVQEYINLIQSVCYIQNSKYSVQFQNSMEILYQIIKAEFKVIDKYRKGLVKFVLDILMHYEFAVQNKILWFLMNKYFVQENIQITILEFIIKNEKLDPQNQQQKRTFKLEYSNQKLLIRLLMHHNQNNEIIQHIQFILNNSIKNTKPIKTIQTDISVKQQASKSTLTTIIEEPQNRFLAEFKKQNYPKCQQLIPQIRNPLLILLGKKQIQSFLSIKNLAEFQNLLNFLVKNPSTRNQILSIQQFYVKHQSIPYILKMAQIFSWNSQNFQKIKIKSFDRNNGKFCIEPHTIQKIVRQTVSKLFQKPGIKKTLSQLLKSLKTQQNQFQLIQFYSKALEVNKNKILFQIINQFKFQQGIQLMKINLPYKISKISQAPADLLLYHLYVHIQTLFFTQTPELQNQQRYIKDVVSLTCPHEIQKYLSISNLFFINLSSRSIEGQPSSSNKINSKMVFRELLQVCYRYLIIFENANSSGNAKGVQIKIMDCFGILSAYLFMHINGQNINTVVTKKILGSIQNKVNQNDILKDCFNYLQEICATKQEEKLTSSNIQNNKINENGGKSSKINQKQNKNAKLTEKQAKTVVFPVQVKQQQQLTPIQQQNQVNQAFQKSKQLQQYLSVVPSQMKALNAKNQKNDQLKNQNIPVGKKINNLNAPQESTKLDLDQENIIRPKQQTFDLNKFYQIPPQINTQKPAVSEAQRQKNLQAIRAKQNQQVSIATLKEHSKFIGTLNDCNSLTKQQIQQLLKSIDNITITVNQHHYYVKKLIELEVPFKLIKLYKCKDKFIPKQLSYLADLFQSKLLKLHHAMSIKKQKKTIVFDDELTISFLKLILKKSINNSKSSDSNLIVIEIIQYCIKSIQSFFKQGLISILLELIKLELNSEEVLKFFCKIELSKHIIYQIYQRGLLNKLVEVFADNTKEIPHNVFNLWIKLAGKICTSPPIQQKYLQKNIHKLIWQKYLAVLTQDLQSSKNVAYFFAFLCKKNFTIFQYVSQNQILQKLLNVLQNQNSEQLYMLFYFIVLQNENALQYCFRIKYHLHLIQKLTKNQPDRSLSKYFYKSLGQMMSNKHHQNLFFKQQVVQKLIRAYENKPEPSIFECLLDFIVTLDNDKQFQELKRQQFWSCLSLFEYKLSSEATYAYILQIFLVMIKKGRIKQFNTPQIRGKVTLKAEFSINLQGKQLALRFITALSLKTKQCYITQRCIRLLSSIVGFKVTSNELDIIEDILDVDGMIENYQFLTFCNQYEIIQTICNRFKGFNQKELLSTIKILNILGTQYRNNKIIRDKLFMPIMQILTENTYKNSPIAQSLEQWLFKLILLIVSFRQNNQVILKLQFGKFMIETFKNVMNRPKEKRKVILEQYISIVELSRQNNMIPLKQLETILANIDQCKLDQEVSKVSQIKQNLQGSVATQTNQIIAKMTEGTKVRMYKHDGSHSQLLLFLTQDKLQLNCVAEKGEPVKQKWRLVLSQIHQINNYGDENQYKQSAFYKAGGIFSSPPERKFCITAKSKNNQFNILFFSKQLKQTWIKYIEFAIENSKKILKFK